MALGNFIGKYALPPRLSFFRNDRLDSDQLTAWNMTEYGEIL